MSLIHLQIHSYIPTCVVLNPSASNTCDKTNYTYRSEISFAFWKRLYDKKPSWLLPSNEWVFQFNSVPNIKPVTSASSRGNPLLVAEIKILATFWLILFQDCAERTEVCQPRLTVQRFRRRLSHKKNYIRMRLCRLVLWVIVVWRYLIEVDDVSARRNQKA